MYMALDLRCVAVSFTNRVSHLLSNWMGVGTWACLIYSRVVWDGTASRVLMNLTPVFDYLTEDMKELMTLMLAII